MITEPQLDRIAGFALAGGISALVIAIIVVLQSAAAEIQGLSI